MNYKKIFFLISCFLLSIGFSSCNAKQPDSNEKPPVDEEFTNGEITDKNEIDIKEPDISEHNFTLVSHSNGTIIFKCQECNVEKKCFISYLSGTSDAYQIEGNTITFSNITDTTSYDISGSFYGNIIIDAADYKFELQMSGLELYSYSDSPITIMNGDKVTLSAKKSTENYIYDMREEISSTDQTSISASIYSLCDLDIQGKGSLFVKSINRNGIHTKDDLTVKNLSLQVDCRDNALKGNDSVTIESGSITLIARQGDGIKTTNSNISSKGKQKGTISLTGGDILIYAACDGLDAAYDVELNETTESLSLQIFTDKYSKYSEEVTAVADSLYYIRFNSTAYKYSLKFYNDESDVSWQNSTSSTMVGNQRYFPITKPSGYSNVQLYIYNSSQQQGQDQDYTACTEEMKVNDNYDTIAIQSRGNTLSYSWTNFTTATQMPGGQGGMGGFGGMNNGNTDKGDYSTKGIKADNKVVISAGTITISSYDDAIHANNDISLENGDSPSGDVTISGGILLLRSNDDAVHADGIVSINGGNINIISSYEGIEGNTVVITDGNISIVSTDDGINGCKTSGTTISISGGKLYVYAGGDGVDSNSTSSYEGIHFAGGVCVIFSTGQADSSIDTERGYKYTGGYVIGIGKSGGMGNEATMCNNFSSIGTSKTISLQKDSYLVINDIVTIQIPIAMNALVVCLGKTNADISSNSTNNYTLDNNGVYWNVN